MYLRYIQICGNNKMKIILPYKKLGGVSIHDSKIMGGMEKFGKMLFENIEGIIPVEFTEEDQRKRLVTEKIIRAVKQNNADMVLNNYDNRTLTDNLQKHLSIPVAWICHNLGTSISKVALVQIMPDFVANGGSIFMVTRYQHKTWSSLSRRINGADIDITVSGYINSSCCTGSEVLSKSKDHDIIVVSRYDRGKDPFSVNWKIDKLKKKTGIQPMNSTIVTSKYRIEKNKEYMEKNAHWETEPEYKILWNLDHSDVLDNIAKSKVLVSTLPEESFGITTLEALSHGVPVILFCKPDLTHASCEIPANEEHIVRIRKSCSPEEFLEAYNRLSNYSNEKSQEIYDQTQAKHSKEAWIESVKNIIDVTMSNYGQLQKIAPLDTLDNFF
jgi:glycosyltransferase involved in cell wall biosynthesis